MKIKYLKLIPLVLITILLLSGCFQNIETNISGTEMYVRHPEMAEGIQDIDFDVYFEDFTTQIINPETGDPFVYTLDDEFMYFASGIQDNLSKVLAEEGVIYFGFLRDEPRQSENPNIDYLIIPIEEIINETGDTVIRLEFVDLRQREKMTEHELDLTPYVPAR